MPVSPMVSTLYVWKELGACVIAEAAAITAHPARVVPPPIRHEADGAAAALRAPQLVHLNL
jgi:hypothetical protein